jgi:hypothetical protein
MAALYDNYEGYSEEAQCILSKVERWVKRLLLDYPEYNALELLALINEGASSAKCSVSLERRLGRYE